MHTLRRLSLFDAFALLAIGAAFVLGFGLPLQEKDHVVYVSPTGSDWFSDGSQTSPLATITEALRRVADSGKVRLLDGAYVERVHIRHGGAEDRPLIIEAVNPGQAVLTWKSDTGLPVLGEWKSEGDGIYSVDTQWPVYWMREGERSVLRVPDGKLDYLRRLVTLPGSDNAFTNADGRLFIYLKGRTPGDCDLETHREVPPPREWGVLKSSNMWIEAGDVHIRGIHFDFGIGSGIRVRKVSGIRVENCAFTGASQGVRVDSPEASNLSVDRCLYHNFPQGDWSPEWLNWKQMYACYSDNGLLNAYGSDVRVTNSIVVHCADGMHISPHKPDGRSSIHGNWIGFTSDDGLELDGLACNITVSSNLFLDCFVGVSCSPVRQGPVHLRENVLWNRSTSGAHLKWVFSPRIATETRNVDAERNLFVGGTPSFWRPEIAVKEMRLSENLFALRKRSDKPWPDSVEIIETEILALDEGHDLSPWELKRQTERAGPWPQWGAVIKGINQHPGPAWWHFSTSEATRKLEEFAQGLAGLAE